MGTIVYSQPATAAPSPEPAPEPRRRIGLWALAGAGIAALVALGANIVYLLNHYFVDGAYLLDSSWLMQLTWRPGLDLANPSALVPPGGGLASFYNYHISPIFHVLGAPSWVAPTDWLTYSMVVSAAQYALLSFGAALAGASVVRTFPGPVRLAGALAAGVTVAFSGLVLSAISFPHFEVWFVGFASLFLIFLAYRRIRLAIAFFILALMVREDGGLILFGLLTVLVVHDRLFLKRAERRHTATAGRFALAAIAWTICAFAIAFSMKESSNAFGRIYLGDPPLAHITPEFVSRRLHLLFEKRLDLLIICGAPLLLAIVRRRLDYVVAAVAFLPWLCINLFAKSDFAGLIAGYYAYPFVLATVWPLLAEALRPSPPERRIGQPLFLAAIVAGFVGSSYAYSVQWPEKGVVVRMLGVPDPSSIKATAPIRAWLLAGGPERDRFFVNGAIASLEIDDTPWSHVTEFAPPANNVAGLIYMDTDAFKDVTNAFMTTHGLSRAIRFGRSRLWAAVPENADARTLEVLKSLTTPETQLVEINRTFVDMMVLDDFAVRTEDGFTMKPGKTGVLAYGPRYTLPPGDYRVTHTFTLADCAKGWGDVGLETMVTTDFGQKSLQRAVYAGSQLAPQGCTAKVEMDFSVAGPTPAAAVEFNVVQSTPGEVRFTDVRYEPRPAPPVLEATPPAVSPP